MQRTANNFIGKMKTRGFPTDVLLSSRATQSHLAYNFLKTKQTNINSKGNSTWLSKRLRLPR